MTASEDKRPLDDDRTLSVEARCEGCGLAYELDLLGPPPGEPGDVCDDCGSPVYVFAPLDEGGD